MKRQRTQRNTQVPLTLALAGLIGACGDDADALDTGTSAAETTEGPNDTTMTEGSGSATSASSTADDGDTSDDSLDSLSDEFDDPSTLGAWTRREQVEGGDAYVEALEIEDGRLRLRPAASGWYANFMGPMLFKVVSGDFAVEASVRASASSDANAAPSELFNAGGLIVRDPGSRDGAQNWITHNVGRQQPNVGTEGKSTRDSQSELELIDGLHHGVLRICRVGGTFVLARSLGDEAELREMHRFERSDLPDTVQVGMMANGWNSSGEQPDTSVSPDVEVTFDYVRFWRPQNESDCLRP